MIAAIIAGYALAAAIVPAALAVAANMRQRQRPVAVLHWTYE